MIKGPQRDFLIEYIELVRKHGVAIKLRHEDFIDFTIDKVYLEDIKPLVDDDYEFLLGFESMPEKEIEKTHETLDEYIIRTQGFEHNPQIKYKEEDKMDRVLTENELYAKVKSLEDIIQNKKKEIASLEKELNFEKLTDKQKFLLKYKELVDETGYEIVSHSGDVDDYNAYTTKRNSEDKYYHYKETNEKLTGKTLADVLVQRDVGEEFLED